MLGRRLAQTLPFPIPTLPNSSKTNSYSTIKPLNLRSSLSNPAFPLGSKITVRNLGYSTSESNLKTVFSSFGEIAHVKIVKDEATKKSKGYAYIQYARQEEAILALENMDLKMLHGRLIHVELTRPERCEFGQYPKASGPPKA